MADTYTQYTQLPGFVQPYAEGYLQRAQQVADMPYQQYTGQRVAGMDPWQSMGYQAQANRALQGNPMMQQAQTALGGYMGPQQGATRNPYAGQGNPYLQQQIDTTLGDVSRGWNMVQAPGWETRKQRSGSFGNEGVAMAEQMARSDTQRNMGNIASQMRFQDYTQQQQMAEQFAQREDAMRNANAGRGLQAIGMAPALAQADYMDIDRLTQSGQAMQGQQQKELDNAYAQFLESRNYPREQLDVMGQALGRSYGQQTSSTQPGVSGGAQALGGGLTGLALYKMLFGG